MTESILYSRSNLDLLHSHYPSKILLSALCSTRFLHSGWLELESLPALFEPWELFSYNLVVIARDVCKRCESNPWTKNWTQQQPCPRARTGRKGTFLSLPQASVQALLYPWKGLSSPSLLDRLRSSLAIPFVLLHMLKGIYFCSHLYPC